VLKTPIGQDVFSWVGAKITRVLNLSYVGSDFVFGALACRAAACSGEGGRGQRDGGARLRLRLPDPATIIFVASVFAILYHLGVMQVIVKAVAEADDAADGASGAKPERGRLDLHGPDPRPR